MADPPPTSSPDMSSTNTNNVDSDTTKGGKERESENFTSNTSMPKADTEEEQAASEEDQAFYKKYGTYDRYMITEDDCYEELGYSWPKWKKWRILTIVFLVQVSMNFNTALYSNGISGISAEFGVSHQAARLGAALFLIFYAFGCELWAPWSEELGRFPVLQLSLFLVNIWQIPVAIAPNFGTILAGRSLGGLSTAGGSVTLAMVADMWEADVQQYAVAYIVFSSVGGSVLGPIVGGFVEEYLPWRWNIWIQLIFGLFVETLHFVLVPETRSTILMDRIAKRRRQQGDKAGVPVNIWGPNELTPWKDRFSMREILITWVRPFRMFLTEPIVLCLSLLSGFSDAIIFMFLQSYGLVYGQWNFGHIAVGLAFIPIGIGYLLAWLSFLPAIKHNMKVRAARPNDEHAQYENRLWWLLYTVPCLPIGLIMFAWTSTGPPIHWIGSMIASAIIAVANYAIYMATIDYMVCAYGPYSASATGGNGWSRDIMAGIMTLPATPFYQNIPSSSDPNHLAYASTILFGISLLLVGAVYIIYWKGPILRKRSPFAQQLAEAREETGGRISALLNVYGSRRNSVELGRLLPGSRRGSVRQTEAAMERLQERRSSFEGRSHGDVREV